MPIKSPQTFHLVQPWPALNALEIPSLPENSGFAGLPITEYGALGDGEKYRPGLNHVLHPLATDSAGQLTAVLAR